MAAWRDALPPGSYVFVHHPRFPVLRLACAAVGKKR